MTTKKQPAATAAPEVAAADDATIDLSHPAVDIDPRAGTTDIQNRIDFNDPAKPGIDVVTEALSAPSGE